MAVRFPIYAFGFFILKGEVTELVPVPAFKAAVTVREYSEVSSILMLSRQFSFKYQCVLLKKLIPWRIIYFSSSQY